MREAGNEARDLIVYFIGHGGFVGHDADLYLAIRRTRTSNPRISGIAMLWLADTLREKARYLRRIVILDCCFAAAAFSAFQSGPDAVAVQKTVTAFLVNSKSVGFPTRGTSLLCSSNQKSPSLLLPDNSSTMFTKAFLDALLQGMPSPRDRFSLRDVKDITTDRLSEMPNAPKPLVLSPDQSEGDIADIPFFPNPSVKQEQRQEQSLRSPNQTGRRRGQIIAIIALVLILVSSGIYIVVNRLNYGNVSLITPNPIATPTLPTPPVSTADFTVSPPRLNNMTLVSNDSQFDTNHSILASGQQVEITFNHLGSIKKVKVTIRGLVSRNEPGKGDAPINLSCNGTQFISNFTVQGEGFDPTDNGFQIPAQQLIAGGNRLTLQVASDASTLFWLYSLEVQQSP
jgi:hypothetical protein